MSKTSTTTAAKTYAADILELERRGDYSGLRGQAIQSFTEAVFSWGSGGTQLYRLPNGRKVKDIRRAITEWANS